MDKEKEKRVAEEYKEFTVVAEELTQQWLKLYPLSNYETERDRYEEHMIGMLEMYSIRYGDPEERLRIVDYIEKQLFGKTPTDGTPILPITLKEWRDGERKAVLSGEYKDLSDTERL